MSVLDWDGLIYYDKKIKKHIKDKISEAVLNGEGGTIDSSKYATKEDLTSHTSDTGIHVTTGDKAKWNEVDNKVDKTSITTTIDSTSTDIEVPSAKSVKIELDKKAGTDKISHVSKYVCADSPIINDTMYRLYSGNDNVRFQKFINFATSNRKVEWDYNLFNKDYGLFAQAIGQGKDLNDIRMNCFFTANNKCLNIPDISKNFFGISLCHAGSNLYSTQICVGANENETTTKQRTIYVRHCYNGTWGNWGTISSTSVADVPYTKITLDTSIWTSGNVRYEVKNGICYVGIEGLTPKNKGVGIVISNSMPKPEIYVLETLSNLNTATVSINPIQARIAENSTTLVLHSNDNTGPVFGSFSYPVSES